MVDSDDAGRKAARAFAEAEVNVIVFAPTMAAPPSYGWEAIKGLPRVPVVAVGAQELDEVPDDYATEEATRRSLPVGLVMFTNVLVREGRRFTTLISSVGAAGLDAALGETLRAADAAALVRNSRLLAIGAPISGYLDVEVSHRELQNLGVEVIDIDAGGIGAAFASVDGAGVETLVGDLRSEFDTSAVDDMTLERSARLALAMDELCRQHGANAGAVNCHGDVLRWNPAVGITACLGVALCTRDGKPFACTGDIPTGIALAIGKRLAGSALYCELYQMDFPGNWILLANGGEGDLSIRARSSTVRLLPEDHYMGTHGPGTAVAFELPEGPATLISLTPINQTGGWAGRRRGPHPRLEASRHGGAQRHVPVRLGQRGGRLRKMVRGGRNPPRRCPPRPPRERPVRHRRDTRHHLRGGLTNLNAAPGYDNTLFWSWAVRRTQSRAKVCAKSTSPRALAMTMPAFRSLLR